MAEDDYPWQQRRRTIKYRGHAIEVLVQRRAGGHRHQVHQYAGYDVPYAETFGLRAGTYTFDAIVPGPEYDRDLAALEATLKKPGRGRLSLWFGPDRFVVCRRWRISEHAEAAGYAKVTIEFVDAGRAYAPSASAVGQSLIDKTLAAVKSGALDAFTAVTGTSLAEIDELATEMVAVSTAAFEAVEDTMDLIDQAAGAASDLATKISRFTTNVASLATDAFAIGTALVDAVDELAALPGETKNKFTSLLDLVPWGRSLDSVSSSSSLAIQAQVNQDGYAALMAQLAVVEAARTATLVELESSQDAAELRDTLTAVMDVVILAAADAGDDVVYRALRDTKTAAVANLDAKAARLPFRVDLMLDGVVPSLVLSHRLYGTYTRDTELVARNHVRNPGFVPAGEELDVLAPLESGQ